MMIVPPRIRQQQKRPGLELHCQCLDYNYILARCYNRKSDHLEGAVSSMPPAVTELQIPGGILNILTTGFALYRGTPLVCLSQ